jgi:hypothetical protein
MHFTTAVFLGKELCGIAIEHGQNAPLGKDYYGPCERMVAEPIKLDENSEIAAVLRENVDRGHLL